METGTWIQFIQVNPAQLHDVLIRWEQTHAFLAKHVYAMTPKRTKTLSADMMRCYLYRSQVLAVARKVTKTIMFSVTKNIRFLHIVRH
jgi:methionyl-tRNA formyltransferase